MNIPKGYKKINGVDEVFVSESEVVITGIPEGDEHDCDQMGCSSVNHVIYRKLWSENHDRTRVINL